MRQSFDKVVPFEDKLLFGRRKVKDVKNRKWQFVQAKFLRSCEKGNAFNAIFTSGLCIGLPLSSRIIKENRTDIGIVAKVWCYAFAILKTIMFVFNVAYLHQFLQALSISTTFYGYTVCGYLTTLLLFKNRKKLYMAIQNLTYFSTVMNPDSCIGSKYARLLLGAYFSSLVLLQACVFVFFFFEQYNYPNHAVHNTTIYVPSFIPEDMKESYMNFVVLCVIATFGLSISTSGFMFILCINLYAALANLIDAYDQKLKDQIRCMDWGVEVISEDINVFKNLVYRVHEVDSAVNMYVFLMYGALISGFFNTVSVMIMGDDSFRTPISIVYIVMIFSTAVTVLFVVSCCGSKIIDKSDQVKRRMVDFSDKFVQFSPSVPSLQVFNLLFEIISKSDIMVTGGGMFVINCALVLTIASVMVTYGVLILQLDQK
ncbi:hypothetical protein AVEN_167773-1 [Araneus ventricosus]|uniref:Odorant receptor n=1 Tax=Araneus ventricosus TaxID=182803 RepID=A0A4Y2J7L5_ARAVE|nr:hypothetical protein AVEN_167773-1 [Araneus ventricosus]